MRNQSLMCRLAVVCLTVVLAACQSQETREAHDRGVARARRDIAAGRPALLYTGLPMSDASPLDPSTGLPRYSRGCVVSDRGMAEQDAYNDTIREALENGELDHLVLSHKVTTHGELSARFAAADGGLTIDFETGKTTAPGARFDVELAPRGVYGSDTPYLFVTDRESGKRVELTYVGEPTARILFDHDGTTLLARDDHYQRFVTFDLPQALEMQIFVDPDREW